jgi:glycosyltransferase involved in cell wall biosynthesis
MAKGKALIFFYEGWVDVSPTVIGISQLLASRDFEIVLFARRNDIKQVSYTFAEENIKLVYLNHCVIDPDIRQRLSQLRLRTTLNIIDLVFFIWQVLIKLSFSRGLEKDTTSVSIGIDSNGSVCAWLISVIVNSKLAYVSLEMTLKEKFRNLDRLRLYLEKLAFRRAICVITQDANRFSKLCDVHEFRHPCPIYVTNSGYQRKQKKEETSSVRESNFFRKKFDISNSDFGCLVLHAGMIRDDVLSHRVAETFNHVTAYDCALIFHERFSRTPDDPYIRDLIKLNSKNLFLSLEPLPFEEIHIVFNAADIGLLIYNNEDENFVNIGKASGKLAQYLRFGKPVLMNAFPSLSELNSKYKIGVTINDPSDPQEFQDGVLEIMNNYQEYSTNAYTCYREEFDMEKQLSPFFEVI